MDFSQALSMFQVGAITGATAVEKPTQEGSVWVVELIFRTPLPAHLSGWLEVARGGKKIFKSIQAALNDIKNIGVNRRRCSSALPTHFEETALNISTNGFGFAINQATTKQEFSKHLRPTRPHRCNLVTSREQSWRRSSFNMH